MEPGYSRLAAALLSTSPLIWGCGSSEPNAAGTGGASGAGTGGASSAGTGGASGGYAAKYVADSAGLHVGKSRFQVELTSGGKPAGGLASSLVLQPMMQMPMMAHGAPVPIDAVHESATAGTYDCTLFFSMASIDANGTPQGDWSLDVLVGTEPSGSLDLGVAPATGSDTTHVTLKNAADTIMAMGGAKPRNWFLFRDALVATETGHVLSLFLATVQEGMMVWPPVTVGLELVGADGVEQLGVESLVLQASTDGSSWAPMTCDASARCTVTLAGLTAGSSPNVYVALLVNGNEYTTDGSPPDPEKGNGFATFAVSLS